MIFIYMDLKLITPDKIVKAYESKKYLLLQKPYQLNIFGVRSTAPASNKFDDAVGILYKDFSQWNVKVWQATTDPGLYWLNNPSNVNGTAIMVPGQYLSSHKIGLHKGQYKALVQNSPIKVYRDSDKDSVYDIDITKIDSGFFGINIHRANPDRPSTLVDKWSAGCQVLASPKDFQELLDHCENHRASYGDVFNYTLLLESELT